MNLNFFKYHGTGNDFILIDNRKDLFDSGNQSLIKKLCDRRFGIGADGLMLLNDHDKCDFEMIYFNRNGKEGSMCGNGGRCITAFAHFLGIVKEKACFMATDGVHNAEILNPQLIKLKMSNVETVKKTNNFYFLDTGSPHHVTFIDNIEDIDVNVEGRKIRYNEQYKNVGTNVNFVQPDNNKIHVRTYERGVESETLSCGTGSVASAIVYFEEKKQTSGVVSIETIGGNLEVFLEKDKSTYKNIWLKGPAVQAFNGVINLSNQEF